jgi:3D (Asp-Asp-Asp) domain-containing protein
MNKNRLRTSITGIAISLSLLSGTSLAIAKPSLDLQEPTPQPHSTSIEYMNIAKTLSLNANRFTFAPLTPDVKKTEQKQPTHAAPVAEPNKVDLQKKAIAVPMQKPQIKNEALKKVQPVAEAHTNAAASPILKHSASAQIHTLEVSPGKTMQYKRLIPVIATAYTAAAEENGIWGAFDYFGNPLKTGTIAVDPTVIPLGSTVYITGYQYNGLPAKGMIAKATDMGSAIKGKRIDIFVPASRADASEFGMQDVKVYIIK